MEWMMANELKLIADKVVVLLVNDKAAYGLRNQPVLGVVVFPFKEQVSRLGVVLDPGLQLKAQVSSLAHSVFFFSSFG